MLTVLWVAVAVVATMYAALIFHQLNRLATATEIQASIMNLSAPEHPAPCWGIVEQDDQIAIAFPDGTVHKYVVAEVFHNNSIRVAPYLASIPTPTPTPQGDPA